MSNAAEFDKYVARNQRFRRWLFRGGIVLACLLVVIVADYLRRVERQHSAVVDLKQRGVMIFYVRANDDGDPKYDEQPMWVNDLFENDWLGAPSGANAVFGFDRMDDRAIEQLAKLQRLKALMLHRAPLSPEGLEALTNLRNLRMLDLMATPLGDEDLAPLRKLRQLHRLGLAHTSITDGGIDALADLPQLEILDLRETLVSANGIAKLQTARPGLKIVWTQAPSSDHWRACADIVRFGGELKSVKVWDDPTRMGICVSISRDETYKYGEQAWRGSQAELARLPDIQGLSLLFIDPEFLGQSKWNVLQECPDLRVLILYGGRVTDDDLSHLKDLPALTHLHVTGSPVTDVGLRHLRECRQLIGLGLERTKITDEGLESLESHTALKRLNLSGTAIGDPGMKSLRRFSQLTFLSLSKTAVGDEGLAELSGLSQLETLFLQETNITDAGLESLAGLSSLKYVQLGGNPRVTDEGTKRLKTANPKLGVR